MNGLSDIFSSYSAVGDIITIAICIICFLLLMSTYTSRQKSFVLFVVANSCIIIAAISNILYNSLILDINKYTIPLVFISRNCHHIMLIITMVIFYMYISDLIAVKGRAKKICDLVIYFVLSLCILIYNVAPFFRIGFYIDTEYKIHEFVYFDLFKIVYVFYLLIIAGMVTLYNERLIPKIYKCIRQIAILSISVMVFQALINQTSFTCVTYTFPVLAVLFMFHYNSYDYETGTLDIRAYKAYVKDLGEKEFSAVYFILDGINSEKVRELAEHFFKFNDKFFKNSLTFRVRENMLVIIYKESENPLIKNNISRLLEEFDKLCVSNGIDKKIILLKSQEQFNCADQYIDFVEFIENKMLKNTVYSCNRMDVEAYAKNQYIISELKDISIKGDLYDSRVKVYCQPVLDTRTNTFTSAEALMRMELPKCGLIFPDTFIPLAEKNGYIHALSKIILNKTCRAIRELLDKGLNIERISVNFSITELKNEKFCDDVIQIIKDNNIAYDKIAVELTESRNEQDFEMVKTIMANLHKLGVKFYLDDFGTGYSSFERIIGLPIDIIKFDRSLTIMAGKDEGSRYLVGSFSDIFKKSGYQILFEGVEDDNDERICLEMNALFLQGYKYSKPVPIERLRDFLR